MSKMPASFRHISPHTIGPIVLAISTATAAMFGALPVLNSRTQRSTLHERINTQERLSRGLTMEVAQRRERVQKLKHELEESRIDLGTADRVNATLGRIAAVAAQSGVLFESLEHEDPVNREHFTTTSITMRGQASYPQLLAFVDQLHAESPDIGVDDLRYDAMISGAGSMNLTMRFVWYTKPISSS